MGEWTKNFYIFQASIGKNRLNESEVIGLTVQSDLEKAIASAEAAKGSYLMMASSTQDTQAKQMFNSMKSDIDRHILWLNNRVHYLNSSNELNKQ